MLEFRQGITRGATVVNVVTIIQQNKLLGRSVKGRRMAHASHDSAMLRRTNVLHPLGMVLTL